MKAKVTVRQTTFKDIVVEVDAPPGTSDQVLKKMGELQVVEGTPLAEVDFQKTYFEAIAVDRE